MLSRVGDEQKGIHIQATTLDDFVRAYKINKIDILKIDAEFSEDEIIRGAESFALAKTDRIVMEYHSKEKKDRVEAILKAHKFKKIQENGTIIYFIKVL